MGNFEQKVKEIVSRTDEAIDLGTIQSIQGAIVGNQEVTDLLGTGLSVDGSGTLNAAAAGETKKRELSVADGGKEALLDTDVATAVVEVIDEDSEEIGEFNLRGSNNDVQEKFDTQTHFTTTEDNAGSINVYWDAGNSRYEINNETGTDPVTITVFDRRP